MLAKYPTLRTLGFRIDVDAFVRLPDTRQMTERSEINEGVRGYVVGFGEDICGYGQHSKTLRDRAIGNSRL
jgi:hypothetical protein